MLAVLAAAASMNPQASFLRKRWTRARHPPWRSRPSAVTAGVEPFYQPRMLPPLLEPVQALGDGWLGAPIGEAPRARVRYARCSNLGESRSAITWSSSSSASGATSGSTSAANVCGRTGRAHVQARLWSSSMPRQSID